MSMAWGSAWGSARRIPAQALAQRKADAQTLQTARMEADRLIETARMEAVKLREQGYQAGLAEARQQALEQQLRQAKELAAFRDQARREMAQVFVQGLEHVLAGPARESFYAHFLEQGRRLLGRMRFARLQVHADDEARVRAMVDATAPAMAGEVLLVESHPRLGVGDCALVSESGKVSVSLSARWEELSGALNAVFAHQDPQDQQDQQDQRKDPPAGSPPEVPLAGPAPQPPEQAP